MPEPRFLDELQACDLLTAPQAAAIADYERRRPFSLHYEIRTLLYLGIVLLSGGLGGLLYQHLDDLGHATVVAIIALLTAACFTYAARHRQPFTWGPAPTSELLPDYLLLLGCLLFLGLEGYVQAEYGLFGTRYGLALAVPAALFFYLAYRFDHRGVLSMAITALAAWVGLSVEPLSVFENQFLTAPVSRAALGLGAALAVVGWLSETRRRKPHFALHLYLAGQQPATRGGHGGAAERGAASGHFTTGADSGRQRLAVLVRPPDALLLVPTAGRRLRVFRRDVRAGAVAYIS